VSYYAGSDVPVLMLALISKGERADLSEAERNALRKELAGYVRDYRASLRKRVPIMKGDTMSNLGKRLIRAAGEGRAIARGEADPATYRVHVPAEVDVRKIRQRLKLSQDEFAARFGLSVATVREWEQNRRRPEGAARVLLTVIEKEPEAVTRALAGA
jgi:putative transcriptional regulator